MKNKSEAGFSYVDVMIAIVILMVGILALMSGISAAVISAKGQGQQTLAKQIATSTMESIMSVKETDPARLGWNAVGNIGSNPVAGVPQGIFVVGAQSVLPNGGLDEVLGTTDDSGTPLTAMRRQIIIADECDPQRPSYNCATPGTAPVRIRTVRVIITYYVGALARQEEIRTVLTDYTVPD